MPPEYAVPASKWTDSIQGKFLRFAAGGWIPAKWFLPHLPPVNERAAKVGNLHIEIVSHCWNYAHFLSYQLDSLAKFPPTNGKVTMTVFYCSDDITTTSVLNHFEKMEIPNVTWNWCELPKIALFRRTIGRNLAALNTKADWIWFTDCDLMFRQGCMDSLIAQLQNRQDALVYPQVERCTTLLTDEDPMLNFDIAKLNDLEIDTTQFTERRRTRATGPLQITHGDVARSCGYCKVLDYYLRPSNTWCKAHEDRAFRWLLRTQGLPLDIKGVYRIRHALKGRYTGSTVNTGLRMSIRRFISRLQESKLQ